MFRKYWCLFEMTSKQDKSAKIFYALAATNCLALLSCFFGEQPGSAGHSLKMILPRFPAITDAAQ